MTQLALFKEPERIVNVASVPQRSPFRYPGGKTWLVPRLRAWMLSLSNRPHEFIEPFAGGGIISLTVAFEKYADLVTMIELDDGMAAAWETILNGNATWLAEKIFSFDLTHENIEAELSRRNPHRHELGFITLLRNRISHGGILAPGSGVLKYGENGKGVRSRWYPDTLRRRILDIESVKEKIRFIQGDGLRFLSENAFRSDAVFFIDPPYTAAGKRAGRRLYSHNELDHEELFRIAETLSGDFLMTYDNAEGVRKLALKRGFDIQAIPMKNTHHAEMTELLIGRNLDWARD
jgi:DNA adenine methylase